MTEFVMVVCTILFIAVINHAQAYLSRPELLFAVTVTTELRQSEVARRILLRFSVMGWMGSLAAAALYAGGVIRPHIAIVLTICVWLAAFLVARHSTEPHRSAPSTVREVSLVASERKHLSRGLALVLACGPAAILAAKAAWIFAMLGNTSPAVYSSIASIAITTMLIAFSGYGVAYASRKIEATGPPAQAEHRYRMTGFAGLLALAYLMAISLPPVEEVIPAMPFAPALILIVAAAMLVAMVYFGQGGTRQVASQNLFRDPPAGDRSVDDCWKWGIFYYNREDPSIIVEKRFGLGWTWNFGHRASWLILPAVLLSIAMAVFIR